MYYRLSDAEFETLFGFYIDNPTAPDEAGLIHLQRKAGVNLRNSEAPFLRLMLSALRLMVVGLIKEDDARHAALVAAATAAAAPMPMGTVVQQLVDQPFEASGFSGR